MDRLDSDLPEEVRWIVERMTTEDKQAFNLALDAFETTELNADDFAAKLIEQGYPEVLVRWGLHLPPRNPGMPGAFVLSDVGQTIIDAGKSAWDYLTSPPQSSQTNPNAGTPDAPSVTVPALPVSPDLPPPPVAPPVPTGKGARTHQVRYTAAIFPVESGCQNAGTWNVKTIGRYCETLNQFAEKGWHLLRMDVIPFSSGCWPFIQRGNIYLLTFQDR